MSSHFSKNAPSHRQRRVGMIVRRALCSILRRQDQMMTISEVTLSRDLRHAHVFIVPSFAEGQEAQQARLGILIKAAPQLRQKLAHAVDLKYVPDLRFHIDVSFERAQNMDVLLAQDEF